MTALVTGGAGFIGSHIVDALIARGDEVRVLDNLSTGFRENVPDNVTLLVADIRDADAVAEAVRGVEVIFHLAAAISVPESFAQPHHYEEVNVEGTLTLITAAQSAGVRRIVFSSSAAVYGAEGVCPLDEKCMPQPCSPYAMTKYAGEQYIAMYQTETLQAVSLRYFNVFGPRQRVDSAYAAAVPIFLSRAARSEALKIYGDGSQTRDFIYVADVVRANLHACTCPPGVYNVGTGNAQTIQAVAEKIAEIRTPPVMIEYAPSRRGDIAHSCASIEKIRATGWSPKYPFDEGLVATGSYYEG